MKKEMDFRESRQCLWRSRVQPQPGQKEPGVREGQGLPKVSVKVDQEGRSWLCCVYC